MKHNIDIYWQCIKNDIASQLSYKKDFFIQFSVWSIYTLLPFLSITMLLQKFGPIASFDIYQIAILYGVIHVAYDTARMFGRGFDDFSQLLLSGDLDIYLIRPQPVLIQVFCSKIFLRRLAGIIQGAVIIGYGTVSHGCSLTLIIAILCSIIVTIIMYLALLIIYSSLCFITIKENLFSDLIIDSSVSIGFYPMELIRKPLRFIFTYIIPISLCVYYTLKPVLLYHRLDIVRLWIAFFSSICLLALSIMLFQYLRRFYKSVNN